MSSLDLLIIVNFLDLYIGSFLFLLTTFYTLPVSLVGFSALPLIE